MTDTYKSVLEAVVADYEDTGCDGCGTISTETIQKIREVLTVPHYCRGNVVTRHAHTPGPWIMDDRHANGLLNDTDKANLSLVAAAPEMLIALELAQAELNKMGCECDCENIPTPCPVCAVNSAIRKARQ